MPSSDSVVQSTALKRIARSRGTRFTAATAVVGLAVGAIVSAGGGAASAATPRAQSVGRFLDGSAGGMAIQSLVDLKDARAKAAPNTSKRQGVNAAALNAIQVPLGKALQLPGGGVFSLGAANQIAVAKTNEYSYGASGAVENNGGAQLTDKGNKFPADGTIKLSGSALGKVSIPGLPTIPGLPGGTSPGGSLPSLGGVTAKIGAVQALAQTGTGGTSVDPQSSIAGVQLSLGSPALGALLSQLKGTFDTTVLNQILSVIPSAALPAGCVLTAPKISNISLDKGAIVVDVNTGTVKVNIGSLLKQVLGQDISHLTTSNFDLIKFVAQNLPKILSAGLKKTLTGLLDPLKKQFSKCVALTGPLGTVLQTLLNSLNSGEQAIENATEQLTKQFESASGSPLATLASSLTGAVDIGLNVQSGPKIQPHNQQYKYTTRLAKTPDQATNVVKHQSLVRAIEIDLFDAAGSGLGTSAASAHQLAGAHQAAAAGSAAASLALGNAAAGPSTAAPTPTTSTTTPGTTTPGTTTPGTSVPTGVPAGAAGHSDGGSPLLPVGLVLIGLMIAGGGVLSVRTRARGRFSR